MHPSTPPADRAIVEAVNELNRHTAELKTSRTELAALRLPNPADADNLDYVDDLLATATRIVTDICQRLADDFERILRADDDRYDNADDDVAPLAEAA